MPKPISYSVAFEETAITGGIDLWELVVGKHLVTIDEITIGQTSDVGDAADEIIPVSLITGHATTGSGGSAVTPAATNSRQGAADSTVAKVNTTIASSGTKLVHFSESFNIRAGYIWRAPLPMPFETKEEYLARSLAFEPGTRFNVRFGAAPADSIDAVSSLKFTEWQ